MANPNFEQAKAYVFNRLSRELAPNLYYHGIHHTRDHVLPDAEEFAHLLRINGENLLLLLTGALYHDTGYVVQYSQNEPFGVEIARASLPDFGYTPDQIQVISRIIMATQLPQSPKTVLEEIMCDSDLTSLGREDFFDISGSLRREFAEYGTIPKSMTDKEWYEFQIRFLEEHSYFTDAAKILRGKIKQNNLTELRRRIQLTF